jgi:hypothetical protein
MEFKLGQSVELVDAVAIGGHTLPCGTAATVIEVMPRDVRVRLGDFATLVIPLSGVRVPGAKQRRP